MQEIFYSIPVFVVALSYLGFRIIRDRKTPIRRPGQQPSVVKRATKQRSGSEIDNPSPTVNIQ